MRALLLMIALAFLGGPNTHAAEPKDWLTIEALGPAVDRDPEQTLHAQCIAGELDSCLSLAKAYRSKDFLRYIRLNKKYGRPRDFEYRYANAAYARVCHERGGGSCYILASTNPRFESFAIYNDNVHRRALRNRACDTGIEKACASDSIKKHPIFAASQSFPSCQAGDGEACSTIAEYYNNEPNPAVREKVAMHYATRGCTLGAPKGCAVKAEIQVRGSKFPHDPRAATAAYLSACAGGVDRSCQQLNVTRDVAQDLSETDRIGLTLNWYCGQSSVEACTQAAFDLAAASREKADETKAMGMLRLGCDLDDLRACEHLAEMIYDGRGVGYKFRDALSFHDRMCQRDPNRCVAGAIIAIDTNNPFALASGKIQDFIERGCRHGSLENCKRMVERIGKKSFYGFEPEDKVRLSKLGCEKGVSSACDVAREIEGTVEYSIRQNAEVEVLARKSLCEKGETKRCHELGMIYDRAVGVERNINLAKKYYKIACGKSYGPACFDMALLHNKKADRTPYFAAACDAGVKEGCFNAALISQQRKYDYRWIDFSARYYGKACDMDMADGCFGLAVLKRVGGFNLPRDVSGARSLFRKSCRLGNQKACEFQ